MIEVDNYLYGSPLVKDVACLGVGHDRFGEVPVAFVAPSEEIDEEEMKNKLDKFCCGGLERWKRPRLYVKLDEIPRTLAKRTKNLPQLRAIIKEITLKNEDGVVSMGKIRK